MFSRCLRAFAVLAVIAAVCAFSLSSAVVNAQDQTVPAALAKPDRDAPFPAPPAASDIAAAASLPAATAGVDQWSKLVYQSFRDGNWEIYATKGDGSAPVNVSQNAASDARPQLNIGATRIVFNSNRDGNVEIYSVNTDGTGLARLTYDNAIDFAPAWSPDSGRIVFVSNRTGNYEIWVMNADGTSPTQLTFDNAPDTSPAWSPDGQWIAWKRAREDMNALYLMRPDGSETKFLLVGFFYAGDLHWSPASNELLIDADADSDNWNELMILRPIVEGWWDQWEVDRIIDAGLPMVDLWAGAYAPDGKSVAFTRVQYAAGRQGLYLSRSDILNRSFSTDEMSIFPGSGYDMNPAWMGTDTSAPVSHVEPLPAFVRFGQHPVRLQGADQGGSGVMSFDVQYAMVADGPWSDLASGLTTTLTYLPSVEPGSALWLRSRAKDQAGNVEAWPPAADASTQVYAWEVRARGVDSRGVPVANTLTSGPDALQASGGKDGVWQILYSTIQTYTLGLTAPGFGTAPRSTLNLNADARVDLFLPPAAELLQNGGFEDDLGGWTGDGILVKGGMAEGAHSGGNGLLLGSDCVSPCLVASATPELPPAGALRMIADRRGNLHVVRYVRDPSDGLQLLYLMHSIDTGVWSDAQRIGRPPLDGQIMDLVLAVDGQDAVHVAFSVLVPAHWPEIPWYYLRQLPDGSWTPVTELASDIEDDGIQGSSFELTMVGDPVAGVHVILNNRIYLRSQTPGIWSPGLDLYPPGPFSYMPYNTLAVGRDGVVHIISDIEFTTLYRSLSPQGVLSAPVLLTNGISAPGATRLFATSSGALHLILGGHYLYRDAAGFWTEPELLARTGGDSSVQATAWEAWLDDADTLHVFGRLEYDPPIYKTKTDDAGWRPLRSLEALNSLSTTDKSQVNLIAMTPDGVVHILHTDDGIQPFAYWSSPLGSTGVISSVSQAVTLPAQTVHPTLSFFHKALSGDPAGQARLAVTVEDGIGATTVYSSAATSTWTHVSVDMGPWLGKTVTVTLAAEQADGEPLLSVYLDDISLGPWTTPLIREVTPAQLFGDWDSAQITVRGDNFTAGSTVRLGDTSLATSSSDEHTLQAVIPAGIAAGRYDLWVQNPDGQQNVVSGGVTLGGWGYLPVVRK